MSFTPSKHQTVVIHKLGKGDFSAVVVDNDQTSYTLACRATTSELQKHFSNMTPQQKGVCIHAVQYLRGIGLSCDIIYDETNPL